MNKDTIPIERITRAIFVLRRQKVMLDCDLAALYGVEARVLNQAVKRNANRFPTDFMFQLFHEEMESVSQFVIPQAGEGGERSVANSSQIVMSFRKHRGKRYRPYAFTEQGIAMLSSVGKHDEEISAILEAVRRLMTPPEKPRREIGFHVRERAARYRTRPASMRHA